MCFKNWCMSIYRLFKVDTLNYKFSGKSSDPGSRIYHQPNQQFRLLSTSIQLINKYIINSRVNGRKSGNLLIY